MSNFDRFFPDSTMLDPTAVAAAGLSARVLPETLGSDDVERIAARAGTTQMTVCAYMYGNPSHVRFSGEIDDALGIFRDEFSTCLFVSLDAANIHIWMPMEHDFFVIFGNEAALAHAVPDDLGDISYADYVSDPDMPESERHHLVTMYQTYTR